MEKSLEQSLDLYLVDLMENLLVVRKAVWMDASLVG